MDSLQALGTSYANSHSYPENLIVKAVLPSALKLYRSRLAGAKESLFSTEPDDIAVPFREIDALGNIKKQNIYDENEMDKWIQGRNTTQRVPAGSSELKEPKCRFIFLQSEHSWSALKVTLEMLTKILTHHQVQPTFLDFLLVFGSKYRPRDFRFSGFKEQQVLTTAANTTIPSLGRSGKHFQLSYNLRTMAPIQIPTGQPGGKPWSRRQCAVHHQFDVVHGTAVWITASAHDTLKRRIEELTPSTNLPPEVGFGEVQDAFRTSLAVHLVFCQWSMENWHGYIQWLEEVTDELTIRANESTTHYFTATELQQIQSYEDDINEVLMILETNMVVMESLRSFYDTLSNNAGITWMEKSKESAARFSSQMGEMIYELQMQMSRGKVLVKISEDRKSLVRHRIQDQATRKMELLTENMQRISEQGQRETVIMRIITLITLIYLPATFVSTFFSTDVVKYQGLEGSTSFSSLALFRWLQVTLPLTALTLGGAGYLVWRSDRNTRRTAATAELFIQSREKVMLLPEQGW